ncbi:MAG: hypothetical protein P8X90_17665 [Desulfobacterales bacterium]
MAVTDAGNNSFYVTLGIRGPDEAAKSADPNDDTTRIEVFDVTATGFDNSACQSAINELQADSPNQGQIKQDIEDCMGYSNSNKEVADAMNAYNHSIHDCWYYSKHDDWPPGAGSVTRIKNDCEEIYGDGVKATEISPDDRAYVCFGDIDASTGYAGRCWDDATGWSSDACVDAALKDYCTIIEIPEVVDPSDQVSITGEFWNIPAVLIDSGVVAQLARPLAVLKGRIAVSESPRGLLHEAADALRIGAMIFNQDGSKSECTQPDPHILYNCTDPDNKDGGRVIAEVAQSASHTQTLVTAINAVKAPGPRWPKRLIMPSDISPKTTRCASMPAISASVRAATPSPPGASTITF